MSGTAGAPNVATGQTARRCPLCGKPVTPDALGFLECSCGWGGADDPLLTAHGLTRWYRRLDRRLANAQARLAREGKAANQLSPIYLTVLFLISTLIYALFLAIIGLCVYLVVTSARDQDWIGVLLGGVLGAAFVLALWSTRGQPRGIRMAVSDLPHLAEALDEVRARIGAPLPQHVVLVPGTTFFADTRHPPRRLFRRELVLGVGVGALPALSELEAKSILAHELAHLRGSGLALHKYVVVALGALRHVMDLALEGVQGQEGVTRSVTNITLRRRYVLYGNMFDLLSFVIAIVSWTILLSFRLLWTILHLLDLRESRATEFRVDRAAAEAYGAQSFIGGLMGVLVATRTLRGAGRTLVQQMRARGSRNLYEELRLHYAELPASVIDKLRHEALAGFRTLENSHPIDADRMRAVMAVASQHPATDAAPASSVRLIVPKGAESADAIEVKLSELLLGK